MGQHLAALQGAAAMSADVSFAAVMSDLAQALGVEVPPSAGVAVSSFDLCDPGSLLGRDEPWLLEGVRAAASGGDPLPRARAAISGLVRGGGSVALFGSEAAAIEHLSAGGAQVLAVGDALAEAAELPRCALLEVTAERLAAVDLLVVEPTAPAGDLARLRELATAAGARVVFDERRTAFRAAPTTVAALLVATGGRGPDVVLLGSSLAAGLPFAAIVGDATSTSIGAVTAAVVAVVVEQLVSTPVFADLEQHVATIVAAVDAAAAREQVRIAWSGPAAMPSLSFADQEGAEGALILHHFGLELAAAGCASKGPLLLPASLRRAGVAPVLGMFAHAVARVRTLLIEYNSYLSGGLPFVFPGGDPVLRARGVARYRYPKLAEVDVDARGDAIRIAFAASELGAVTSSGFYVPTRLSGDVDVAVRYVVQQFSSGPDATCLGLFLQNEASTARYYAQLMSTSDAPTARSVALGHAGAVIGRGAVPGVTGWLRLRRAGGRVTAWHRDVAEAAWRELGSVAATGDDLIVGAKIWSKVRTEGLVAELSDLSIDAVVAADQAPLLASRPDPRCAARNR